MNDTFFMAFIGCAFRAVAALFVGRDPALEAAKAAKEHSERGEPRVQITVTL